MKILKLPAWLPNRLEMERLHIANYGDVTSFFVERADAVCRHSDLRVDVLMPKIYSVTKLPRLRSLPVLGTEITRRAHGETWVGYYPYLLPWSRPRNWRHFGEKLFNAYVRRHGMPDAIWCAGVLWSAFLANHLHRKFGIPYFIVEHKNAQILDGGTKKTRRIKGDIARVFQEAAFGAGNSRQTAARMQKFLGEDAGEIRVLPNVLSEEFENFRLSEGASGDGSGEAFVFHTTGSLIDRKNHAAIIAAFAEFSKAAPGAVLNIAGAGPNRDKIVRQIADLQLEGRVNLIGYLARAEVAAQLQKSSAFITASHAETFNNSLIEALACGVPCISTAAGVAEEAIDEGNGVVVASASAADILAGMQAIYARREGYDRQAIRAQCLRRYTGAALASEIKRLLAG